MGRDADPPWAIPAENMIPMAKPRPNCQPNADPPPPIGWKHLQRTAATTWTMESLHGLRKNKQNKQRQLPPLSTRHHGKTQSPETAKNTEPNGYLDSPNMLRSKGPNPPNSHRFSKPNERMTKPSPRMTLPDSRSTTTGPRHETNNKEQIHVDTSTVDVPLPRSGTHPPPATNQATTTRATAKQIGDKASKTPSTKQSICPPPTGMTGQLDQALQRVIAQLQMTRPTNQPRRYHHHLQQRTRIRQRSRHPNSQESIPQNQHRNKTSPVAGTNDADSPTCGGEPPPKPPSRVYPSQAHGTSHEDASQRSLLSS